MRTMMAVGVVLVLLGVAGFAIPRFSTSDTKDVADVGGLKLESTQTTGHVIPPMAAGALVLVGMLLLGAGFVKKA